MNDKVELLKFAVQKISDKREYIGYYLKRYCTIEGITDEQLIEKLNCEYENYFKLGLCLAPELSGKDFLSRITDISTYTKISSFEIISLIKHVATVEHFADIPSESILMAARDTHQKNKDADK